MFEHGRSNLSTTWRANRRWHISMARHGLKPGSLNKLPPFDPVRPHRRTESKHRGGVGIFVTQNRGLIPIRFKESETHLQVASRQDPARNGARQPRVELKPAGISQLRNAPFAGPLAPQMDGLVRDSLQLARMTVCQFHATGGFGWHECSLSSDQPASMTHSSRPIPPPSAETGPRQLRQCGFARIELPRGP